MVLGDRVQRAKSYYEKHQKYFDIGVFFSGFFFDIFTLGNVDDFLNITQQAVYLTLLGVFLLLEVKEDVLGTLFSERFKKVWKYKVLIVHFLLGSLLSVYTLFFLKSASLLASFVFILIIVGLLVLNEIPYMQNLGLRLRTVLFSLCVGSFFAVYLPLVFGVVSWVPFLLSMILGLLVTYGMFVLIKRGQPDELVKKIKFVFMYPALITFIMYTNLYGLGLVPPVPLSLQYIGIYHKVEKVNGEYLLSYHRPSWKFWQNGAQTFLARPGDEVIAFATIFSPISIRDRILINWYFDDPKQGWVKWDAIPLTISGGRAEGFRGYGVKKNYQLGDWKVIISTGDGREIGRISFTVEADADTTPIDYDVDRF